MFEPEYPDALRRQIEKRGLSGAIVMKGFQTNVAEWMHAFDVFVHASDREPFGLVVVEAMAMGCPVIATDTAGPTEIVSHGVNGFLASYGDDASLAEHIQRYLENPQLASSMSEAAQVRAQDFSATAFASRVERAVQQLAFFG